MNKWTCPARNPLDHFSVGEQRGATRLNKSFNKIYILNLCLPEKKCAHNKKLRIMQFLCVNVMVNLYRNTRDSFKKFQYS